MINGEKNTVILKFLFDIDAFFITPSSLLKTEKDMFIYRTDYWISFMYNPDDII